MKTASAGGRQGVILEMHCTSKSLPFLTNHMKSLLEVTLQQRQCREYIRPSISMTAPVLKTDGQLPNTHCLLSPQIGFG